jgi:hypothetical protein
MRIGPRISHNETLVTEDTNAPTGQARHTRWDPSTGASAIVHEPGVGGLNGVSILS